MNMTITRLGPNDAARAQVSCALFGNMKDAMPNLMAYLSDSSCILLVAEVDGEPAGLVIGYLLKRWDSRGPMLYLYSIDVVESHRRRGLGHALIKELLRIGKEAGCESSFVFTNESNGPAMQMYRGLGGTRTNTDDVMFEWQMDHEQMHAEMTSESPANAIPRLYHIR